MKQIFTTISYLFFSILTQAQSLSKPISNHLFGIFFEDISYAADGGLYAELIQNRSFEYTAADRKEWHSLTGWEYQTKGFGYGSLSIETAASLNPNNPHYAVLTIEEKGQEGIGIQNTGFDGIVLKEGDTYAFSVFAKQMSNYPIPLSIQLRNKKGEIQTEETLLVNSKDWKKYELKITAKKTDEQGILAVIATNKGKLALDMVSLFPTKTYKGRSNGLRDDISQAIAKLQPKFMRFPGGCLVHGDGLANMYRWKNTIGPLETRVEQKNIWSYHQTAGLGYYEYFQFCEDIGAKPLPVVPAAVSCQNSGGTWRIGGTGQRSLPLEEMKDYIQEILDLIEYANGPATSVWGAKRAAAGHPEPFHLEYIGIGNEDKITPEFKERFQLIYDQVRIKHPEINIIGTVGPAPDGEDFELGWKLSNQLGIGMVDEHYYESPEWFIKHQYRYDSYDRTKSKIYLGEYASRGNSLFNALAESIYMVGLERNADVVHMASYAPLLANQSHTSWNPNLIYFNNTTLVPTVNYYAQQLFSTNQGTRYYSNIIDFPSTKSKPDSNFAASCVEDEKTGDIILKIINAGPTETQASINLKQFKKLNKSSQMQVLEGEPSMKNSLQNPQQVLPKTAELTIQSTMNYPVPRYSLTVIRIAKKK